MLIHSHGKLSRKSRWASVWGKQALLIPDHFHYLRRRTRDSPQVINPCRIAGKRKLLFFSSIKLLRKNLLSLHPENFDAGVRLHVFIKTLSPLRKDICKENRTLNKVEVYSLTGDCILRLHLDSIDSSASLRIQVIGLFGVGSILLIVDILDNRLTVKY